MLYGNSVNDTRAFFFASWAKHQQNTQLTPLEQQVVSVMLEHPEYYILFNDKEQSRTPEDIPISGTDNPFLHLGLHLAVRDQISTDRPEGITPIYKELVTKHKNTLEVEHLLMEALAHCLWNAQDNQRPPDEHAYLDHCRTLIK